MLLSHLKISGLLSFGPDGVDLPLKRLNVLIGPNGSGKSNLLEVLALLRAAPTKLSAPVKAAGGIDEWLWKESWGESAPEEAAGATIEAGVTHVMTEGLMYIHMLRFGANAGRFELWEEEIRAPHPEPLEMEPWWFYRQRGGRGLINKNRSLVLDGETLIEGDETVRELAREDLHPEESVLSQLKDPGRYNFLIHLRTWYSRIALYRNWSFGPSSETRMGSRIDERDDLLDDGGSNLPGVVAAISRNPAAKRQFLEAVRRIYDGITDVQVLPLAGRLHIFLTEEGGRQISATRLSDGTLRCLCLLAVLLHPQPPKLVGIEEPELGLHPDVIPFLAELMIEASERMQLVVTTHSRMLVDALGGNPDCVVVCEKIDGQSRFQRLDPGRLSEWLERYTLGSLWSMGELGGNRW